MLVTFETVGGSSFYCGSLDSFLQSGSAENELRSSAPGGVGRSGASVGERLAGVRIVKVAPGIGTSERRSKVARVRATPLPGPRGAEQNRTHVLAQTLHFRCVVPQKFMAPNDVGAFMAIRGQVHADVFVRFAKP